MPIEYDSPYQKLWDQNIGTPSASVVVEVGINDGRGIRRLKERFPNAQIFGIDEPVREPEYKTTYEQLSTDLSGIATLIIEKSPLSYDWPHAYDFCSIDIGADPEVNLANIAYWLRFKKASGILAIVVPRSTPEKLAKRNCLVQELQQRGLHFQEVYNWFVFT